MRDERRHRQAREQRADVDLQVPDHDLGRHLRGARDAFESGDRCARYTSGPDLDTFAARLATPLFAHLTELHPLWHAGEMRRRAVEHGYWVIADSPFVQGAVGEVREVRRVAERLGASPFQVTLTWLHRLRNVATTTWTHDPRQTREDLAADDLELDSKAIDEIDGIERQWTTAPHLHPVSSS